MPKTNTLRLHDGLVLWPEHKPEAEVLELKDTTIPYIWETTYQGNPTEPGGNAFKRAWWDSKNRYHHPGAKGIARWISFDTAASEDKDAAYTAWAVGDLLADYRLQLVEAGRERLAFPQLTGKITEVATRWKADTLRGVIIEDKSTGISALQTLRQSADRWLASLLLAFTPKVDKPMRWAQAGVWCNLGCVLLPYPDSALGWLLEFEEEIFSVPGSPFKDYADSFAQLILFTENLLSEGYKARSRQ